MCKLQPYKACRFRRFADLGFELFYVLYLAVVTKFVISNKFTVKLENYLNTCYTVL